jgi:hypothetical protein
MARLPAPSLTARWILTIVIVSALLAVGYVYYNRLQTEQEELRASIAQSNATIATFRTVDLSALTSEIAALEGRVTTAESRERALTQRYRGYAHSIEIEETLYRAALESNCTITSVACALPIESVVDGVIFETYGVGVSAEAAVPPELLNFILKVSTAFESGTISPVTISVPRPPEEGTTEEKSSVSFQLRVMYIPQEAA